MSPAAAATGLPGTGVPARAPRRGPLRLLRERAGLLALLPLAGTGPVLCSVAVFAAAALSPSANAVVTGVLVDQVLDSERRTETGGVVPVLVWMAVLLLIGQVGQTMREPVSAWVGRRIDGQLRGRVRAAALASGRVTDLERATFQDDLRRAAERGTWRELTAGHGAVGQLWLMFRYLGLFVAVGLLVPLSPWLAAALLTVVVAVRWVTRRAYVDVVRTQDQLSGSRRRQAYLSDLVIGAQAAKEVRLFDLGGWLIDRRERRTLEDMTLVWRRYRGVIREQSAVFILQGFGGLMVIGWSGAAAASGDISAGRLTLSVFAGWAALSFAGFLGFETYDIEWGGSALAALRRVEISGGGADARRTGAEAVRPSGGPPPAVRFEDVSFAYPGAGHPVLDGLTFDIHPGEILGVVGVNGAGKTTLISILAGLRQPDRGRIIVDGRDLATMSLVEWRRQLTVVFQDFVRYELSLRDNVALSAPEYRHRDDLVMRALRAAHAEDLLDGLSIGLDTPLSRAYRRGIDLSGGQWQRVAIARALFAVGAGSRVLVLDEPTAHLDARAELTFFGRVLAARRDISVVLISHRLSTVRQADRIVLIDGGRIVESGTHDELMAQGGEYAENFTLQADRFRILTQEQPDNTDGDDTGEDENVR
jgi:ATP-binding cassette subfamily B protein